MIHKTAKKAKTIVQRKVTTEKKKNWTLRAQKLMRRLCQSVCPYMGFKRFRNNMGIFKNVESDRISRQIKRRICSNPFVYHHSGKPKTSTTLCEEKLLSRILVLDKILDVLHNRREFRIGLHEVFLRSQLFCLFNCLVIIKIGHDDHRNRLEIFISFHLTQKFHSVLMRQIQIKPDTVRLLFQQEKFRRRFFRMRRYDDI